MTKSSVYRAQVKLYNAAKVIPRRQGGRTSGLACLSLATARPRPRDLHRPQCAVTSSVDASAFYLDPISLNSNWDSFPGYTSSSLQHSYASTPVASTYSYIHTCCYRSRYTPMAWYGMLMLHNPFNHIQYSFMPNNFSIWWFPFYLLMKVSLS